MTHTRSQKEFQKPPKRPECAAQRGRGTALDLILVGVGREGHNLLARGAWPDVGDYSGAIRTLSNLSLV
jgi:hypothetical protein